MARVSDSLKRFSGTDITRGSQGSTSGGGITNFGMISAAPRSERFAPGMALRARAAPAERGSRHAFQGWAEMTQEPNRDTGGGPAFQKTFDNLQGNAPARSGEEIKLDIESALFYDSLVRSEDMGIDVSQGVVTLTGTASDDMGRMRTEDDTKKVPGVRQITDNIQVGQKGGG